MEMKTTRDSVQFRPGFPVNVWWHPGTPSEMFLAVETDKFTDENGEKPGLQIAFSANPRSANYNPHYFNRCVRALRAEGAEAPDEVPIRSRQLRHRARIAHEMGLSSPF